MATRKLRLVFRRSDDRDMIINLRDPKTDLDKAKVTGVMDAVLAAAPAFVIRPVKSLKAELETRDVADLLA